MKYYIIFKQIQGLLLVLFLFTAPGMDAGPYFLFIPVLCLSFLILDFVWLKKCREQEQRLSLSVMTDSLTQLPNSSALKEKIDQLSESILDDDTACVVICFENIHSLNRTYGHGAGDTALQEFGRILRVASSDLCFTGRKSGRTFLSIFEGNARSKAELFLKRLERGVTIHNETAGLLPITYCAGTACNADLHYASIYDLVKIRQ